MCQFNNNREIEKKENNNQLIISKGCGEVDRAISFLI